MNLKRGINGQLSNLQFSSRCNSLNVAPCGIRFSGGARNPLAVYGSQCRLVPRKLLSSLLAATIATGHWTFNTAHAATWESSKWLQHNPPSIRPQPLSLPTPSSLNSLPIVSAQAAAAEATASMEVSARQEGYLMATGHAAQINRLYYSTPKDQVSARMHCISHLFTVIIESFLVKIPQRPAIVIQV